MAGSDKRYGERTKSAWKKRIRGIGGGILNAAIMGVLMFIPAGTLEWPMAWALLAITVISITANSLVISPDLIDERSRRHENVKPWDRYLVVAIILFGFATMVVAGLDFRYRWTGSLPFIVETAAFVTVILSGVILIWAMISNPFFSATIRIQDERGHSVVSGGPYRYVRHPGYAGWILYMLALPLMLGSLYALVPGAIAAGLDIVRTCQEDRVLMAELTGYTDYAAHVRYRLIPGIW